jgi:hypothetical protein
MKRFVVASVLWSSSFIRPVAAQALEEEGKLAAREHFDAGVERVSRGDIDAGLREFQTAYATLPHFSVLYNIGRAHAALGHPVEAVRAFESYLKQGGDDIGNYRRDEVEQLLAASRARIGRLHIVPPQKTRVWLDGTEISPLELTTPIDLEIGRHSLISSSNGGEPQIRAVDIQSNVTTVLNMQSPAPLEFGWLEIECDVPDVNVEMAPRLLRQTPVYGALSLPVGRYDVRFSRPGYVPQTQSVELRPGQVARIACEQQPEHSLSRRLSGTLHVRVPERTLLHLDGRPFSGGVVPIGRHFVRVERDGFEPQRLAVSVERGKTLIIEPALRPTGAWLEKHRARRERRTIGILAAGASAASLAVATTVYVWNSKRFSDWESTRFQPGRGTDFDRVAGLQKADDIAFGGFLLGAGLGLGAAWLWAAED